MGSEIEIPETPKWLQELEEKREKRLRTKLGHELGAGAPCLTCQDTCPGLDLHFWRKICKNCKCSKEAHEVQDDDIYGWVQDELLGTRTKKLQKIVLPGRKDEIELDWTPNGQKETIEKYLKTVPTEMLPIKGTQAAQERKQLLKKQIPIHDIDPTLCHELTNDELEKMQEYIGHVKMNSVGVGNLIQINFMKDNTSSTHIFDDNDTMFLINNIPTSLSNSTSINLGKSSISTPLKNLTGKIDDLNLNEIPPSSFEPIRNENLNRNLVNPTEMNLNPTIQNIRDLAYSTYEPNELNSELISNKSKTNQIFSSGNSNSCESQKSLNLLQKYRATNELNVFEENQIPIPIKIGGIRDLQYESGEIEEMKRNECPSEFIKPEIDTKCRYCKKKFEFDELAVTIPERNSNSIYHTGCFKCFGCNQLLADMFYFYDKDSDNIYCGRDYAKIRGIPRCKACDELIFLKEYCLAENSTFHIKHFCCFECDVTLAGQNYVMENEQPVCIPCFELTKANKCFACKNVIQPDQQGLKLKENVHFHANEQCFSCKICKKSLFGAKLLFRNDNLYCSHDCLNKS